MSSGIIKRCLTANTFATVQHNDRQCFSFYKVFEQDLGKSSASGPYLYRTFRLDKHSATNSSAVDNDLVKNRHLKSVSPSVMIRASLRIHQDPFLLWCNYSIIYIHETTVVSCLLYRYIIPTKHYRFRSLLKRSSSTHSTLSLFGHHLFYQPSVKPFTKAFIENVIYELSNRTHCTISFFRYVYPSV